MSVEVTEVGWLDRIKQSLVGFVVGPILILLAFPVLFWNECNAVDEYKSIGEVRASLVEIKNDKVDKANEGKLVFTTGEAVTKDVLKDTQFGVSVEAVRLERSVQMYQLREKSSTKTKKKVGGKQVKETTYTYEETWSSSVIDSSSFHEQKRRGVNPGSMGYEAKSYAAKNVEFGAFKLSEGLINQLSGSDPVELKKDIIKKLPKKVQKKAKLEGGYLYVLEGGGTPASPVIGDIRISFTQAPAGPVSVIGQQTGDSFKAYKTSVGSPKLMLHRGKKTSEEMLAAAEAAVGMFTWIVRIVGFAMFLIGFNLLFKPLAVLGDLIPFIGSIIGGAGFIVALILSFILSFFTIAIAWVVARPLVGIPLLLLAIGGVVLLIMRGKKKKAEAPAPAEA